MPEGPEVWILSKAINSFYSNSNTFSFGKHLIVQNLKEDWSFGLNGKVGVSSLNELVKIDTGWINGDKIKYEESIKELGIDWMNASKEELDHEVTNWVKSKKKLAGLILDQSKICGIGVAWGSEILFNANLRPDIRACDQVLTNLVDSIIYVRNNIQETYNLVLNKTLDDLKLRVFINEWFDNLYIIREMKVYKKGSKLQVLGRSWWI